MVTRRWSPAGVLAVAGGVLAAACPLAAAASASTYSLTSTADGGPGSLRQAILDANAHSGADRVRFALAGSGVRTIAITSAGLPAGQAVTASATSSGAGDTSEFSTCHKSP
jgi:hypothetical protein